MTVINQACAAMMICINAKVIEDGKKRSDENEVGKT